MKKSSSKKRPASLPSSKTTEKCLCQTEGEVLTSYLIKNVGGKGAVVDARPNITIASSVNPTLERDTPFVVGEPASVSPMPVLPPTSPRLDDLDGLMDQALVDLATAF